MKRRVLPALLALLMLTACGRVEPPPPDVPTVDPPPVVEEREPLHLDALNVEFVALERDTDALAALQRAFPSALQEALAGEDVTVDAVNVTFGTSGEATATALRGGAVELAFLPAESWLADKRGEPVALERAAEADEQSEADPQSEAAARNEDTARSVMVLVTDEPRLVEALRAVLPTLAPTLADYGSYEWNEAAEATLAAWDRIE